MRPRSQAGRTLRAARFAAARGCAGLRRSARKFPHNYHEPYYGSYIGEDFSAVARQYGLMHKRDTTAFVSKVMVFDKPPNR